jgi:hypothetical protein
VERARDRNSEARLGQASLWQSEPAALFVETCGASVATRKDGSELSPYAILGSSVGTAEAAALCVRLTAWHDAMVAHERRLRTGRATDACDDECPHDEARTLWAEAMATLGPRASELTFLRSRANDLSPPQVAQEEL